MYREREGDREKESSICLVIGCFRMQFM
jgi:hypothetical protein